MTERPSLTDEQLRDLQENAETYTMVHSPGVLSAVAELSALRAERAKPTLSDREWAQKLAHTWVQVWAGRFIAQRRMGATEAIASAFASIRAEGSAERALEWASGWHRAAETMCVISGVSPALGADEMATAFRDAWETARAERAKLEAALRELREGEKR